MVTLSRIDSEKNMGLSKELFIIVKNLVMKSEEIFTTLIK